MKRYRQTALVLSLLSLAVHGALAQAALSSPGEEVQLERPPGIIAGTLIVPTASTPVPLVVIIAGSGTDRSRRQLGSGLSRTRQSPPARRVPPFLRTRPSPDLPNAKHFQDRRRAGMSRVVSASAPSGPIPPVAPASAPNATQSGRPYLESEVEKPVRMAPGSGGPVYPDSLRRLHVAGEVLVSFVVDTMGLAERDTFRELKSTNAAFTDAVIAALPLMRFFPAEVQGRKVRQLVQQPFVFLQSPQD
jgi:TonB family protein